MPSIKSTKSLLQIALLFSIIFAHFFINPTRIMAAKIHAKGSTASTQKQQDSGEQEIFLRRQRDLAKLEANEGHGMDGILEGEEEGGLMECTIRVKKVVSVRGKCVKLKGGLGGCQTEQYLDPNNEDCDEED